jgi:hypothetical protein
MDCKLADITVLADVAYYDVANVTSLQPVGRTCPFLLSKAGPGTKVDNDLTLYPDANNAPFSLKITSRINPIGGFSSQPCQLLMPFTIYNDLSNITNNSMCRLLYEDFYINHIDNVASKGIAEKGFTFQTGRPRYLFIIPSLADAPVLDWENYYL